MLNKALSPIAKEQLIQLIVFRAGEEEFCVPIDSVQEIIKVGDITPVPDSPFFLKGLINVRGDIVAIIDVKSRFSLSSKILTRSKHIIITKQETGLFGLMVDEVMEVLRVSKKDINKPPSIILRVHEDYVAGVVVLDERLIILLDLSRVLSKEELNKLSHLTANFQQKTADKSVKNLQNGEKPKNKKNNNLSSRNNRGKKMGEGDV